MMHTSQTTAANLNSTAANTFGNTAEPTIKDLMEIIKEQSFALKVLNEEISKVLMRTHPGKVTDEDKKGIKITMVPQTNTVEESEKTVPAPKILVYGVTKLNDEVVFDIVRNRLKVSYNITLKRSDITFMTSDDKDKLKSKSPVENLKTGKYDYFIAGPHPHSIKGKNLKHSWPVFMQNRKLSTKTFTDHKKPLSMEYFLNIADTIGKEFFGMNFNGKGDSPLSVVV
jgi:SepF-like predicted cell division protein (DUF552 family)